MTRTDRAIARLIEPYCVAEDLARRALLWVAEKAIDQHVCRLSRELAGDEGDE